MPLDRLLLAALILCPLPVFSQANPATNTKSDVLPEFRTGLVTSFPEPGIIVAKSEKDKAFVLKSPELESKGIGLAPDDPLGGGITCLSIRSYVVKRDSKDSDAVHPAGYTTCVPMTRFRLKTADLHTSSPQ